MKSFKKWISTLLVLAMVFCMIPVDAYAADTGSKGLHYKWVAGDNGLASVETDNEYTKNALTAGSGYYAMDTAVTLDHTKQWAFEWRGEMNGPMLLCSSNNPAKDGELYVWVRNNAITLGKYLGGSFYNYGTVITTVSGVHTFRVANEITNGRNKICLYLDGKYIADMNNLYMEWYTNGTPDNSAYSMDFHFSHIGASGFALSGTLEYVEVWEDRPDDASDEHEAQHYKWLSESSGLTSVADDEMYTKNTLTAGNGYYTMETPVVLDHTKPWAFEWRGDLYGPMLLCSSSNPAQDGELFLWLRNNAFVLGRYIGGQYYNYGTYFDALSGIHTFRLANEFTNGNNKICLYVDDVFVSEMNNLYMGFSASGVSNTDAYYTDYRFSSIGATGGFELNGDLEYLEVWEDYGDDDVAAEVVELIKALDTEITLAHKTQITSAREAYEALTDNQKTYINEETIKILTDAEAKVKELEENATEKTMTVRYDDRIDLADLGIVEVPEITTVSVTSKQVGTDQADTAVITYDADSGRLIATGVGEATVKSGKLSYRITVEPAPISLFLLIGQSNMEGSEGDQHQSIAIEDGQVYSSYGPAELLNASNGAGFIPASLTAAPVSQNDSSSVGGRGSTAINALTESGSGKAGADSGIAYEWLKLTGEKVWLVNAAHGGSSIQTWQPGSGNTNYNQALGMFKAAQDTMKREIAAGHYTLSHMGYFWCQGCSNNGNTMQQYLNWYNNMHAGLKSDLSYDFGDGKGTRTFEFGNIILVRAGSAVNGYRIGKYESNASFTHMNFRDLQMTGPRVAQYYMGSSTEEIYRDINLVCNIGDQWVTMPDGSHQVEEFFLERYPNGIDYPTQNGVTLVARTPADVHDSIHYNQVGYNEVGIEAARNTYYLLNPDEAPEEETSITLYRWDGFTQIPDGGKIEARATASSETLVVPVVYPLYKAKQLKIETNAQANNNQYDLTSASMGTVTYTLGDEKVSVKVDHTPRTYQWNTTDSGLVSVGTTGTLTENTITVKAGGYDAQTGKYSAASYALDQAVVLDHTKAWAIEWRAEELQGTMLFSANGTSSQEGGHYVWLYGNTVTPGQYSGGNYVNYQAFFTRNYAVRTFRLANEIAQDGTNQIRLYIDGEYCADVPSGANNMDFIFGNIGAESHFALNGTLEYIQVWEDLGEQDHTEVLKSIYFTKNLSSAGIGDELEVVVCTTDAEVTYQWYQCDKNGENEKALEGANAATYTPGETGYYYCVATAVKGNASCVVRSNVSRVFDPAIYKWVTGTNGLTSVEGEGIYTRNDLTAGNANGYNAATGTYTNGQYTMHSEVVLDHTKAWAFEWRGDINGSMLFCSSDNAKQDGEVYIWIRNNAITLGKYDSGNFYNYGAFFPTKSGVHTYRVANVLTEEGNKICLYIDGNYVADMNTLYMGHVSNGTPNTDAYAMDFIFGSIGTKEEFYLRGNLEYIQVWEDYSDVEEAEKVQALIDAIGEVTRNSGDAIESARQAYDALTEDQKLHVTNYQTLLNAEGAYALLIAGENAEAAEAARVAAEAAQAAAEVAKADAEAAKAAAEAAQAKAEAAQAAAEEAQKNAGEDASAAETAKAAAETAKTQAEAAQARAEEAEAEAVKAQSAAEASAKAAAENDAKAAQAAASAAKTAAEAAANAAASARSAQEAAGHAADAAQSAKDAQAAQSAAESAKAAAEAAKTAAETAHAKAEAAKAAAEEAEQNAGEDATAAENAKAAAVTAQTLAQAAQAKAEAAEDEAVKALAAAEAAAKAAAQSDAKAAADAAKAAKAAADAAGDAAASAKSAEESAGYAAAAAQSAKDAQAAQKAAEDAQAKAEAAKAAAEEGKLNAEAAQAAAEAAKAAAEAERLAAESAQKAAEDARALAEAAKAAAEKGQLDAEAAKAAAEAERKAAEEERKAAEEAQAAAEAAKAAAEEAKAAMEAERLAMEEERKAAEEAEAAAEAAKKAAEEAALKGVKYQAVLNLDGYAQLAAKDGLDKVQTEALADVLAAAKAELEEAKTLEEVQSILDDAKASVDAVADLCPGKGYSDVKAGTWYHDYVDYMIANGYMKGVSDTKFDVDGSVTRGQLVTILYRTANEPSVEGMENIFTDVQAGTYYYDAVLWAAGEGIVNGMTATTFEPNTAISRQQIVTILYRFCGSEKVEEDHLAAYTDADEIATYAVDAMNWAIANEIVNGVTETTLAPAATTTRAQICAIVMRYLEK